MKSIGVVQFLLYNNDGLNRTNEMKQTTVGSSVAHQSKQQSVGPPVAHQSKQQSVGPPTVHYF